MLQFNAYHFIIVCYLSDGKDFNIVHILNLHFLFRRAPEMTHTGKEILPKCAFLMNIILYHIPILRLAGYAISPVSQTDVIVEYFIRHGGYNVMKIDIMLFDYGLDPLSN